MGKLIAIGAGGLFVGFVAGKGTEGISELFKWAVIGGATYVGAKALKVI